MARQHIEARTGTQVPNPEIRDLVSAIIDHPSRRLVLGMLAGTVVGLSTIAAGRWRWPNIFDNPIEAKDRVTQVSDRIDKFLKAPSPNELLANTYRSTESFSFSPQELGHVSLYLFGDSMNLLDGTRHPGEGTQQQGSWGDVAAQKMNSLLTQQHVPGKWEYFNYAIPGSSTVGLVGSESYDHNAQLGNPDVQQKILSDPNTPIVTLGLNGNNWRRTAQYAIDLYKNSAKFKQLMDTLDMKNQNFLEQLQTKGEQLILLLNDPLLCQQINTLIDYFEDDSRIFRQGFEQALQTVTQLNKRRPKDKPIKLAVTLPIDLALRDVVPYAPLTAPRGVREEFNYGDIPNAKEAVYKVTSTIYTAANELLAAHEHDPDFPETITVPFFGLEGDKSLFYHDGHFNVSGEAAVANIFLNHIAMQKNGERVSVMSLMPSEESPHIRRSPF